MRTGLVVSLAMLGSPFAARAQQPVFGIEAAAAGVLSTASDADRQYLLRAIPQIDGGTAVSQAWVAVHTKKDAGRLGNHILREAGIE